MKHWSLSINRVLAASTILVAASLMGDNELASASGARAAGGDTKPQTVAAPNSPLKDYTEEIEAHLISFKMVAVPAGTVRFPDPGKPGATIEREVGSFWISETPVIWQHYGVYAFGLDGVAGVDYDAEARPTLARRGADYPLDEGWGWDDRPAIGMTQEGAKGYVEWLSEKTGRKYRLPTEAEWIYACRGGKADSTPMDPKTVAEQAWTKENSEGKTHPVRQRKPNAFGLYDMLGNVAEWVVGENGERVVMGGSHRTEAAKISCTLRQVEDEDDWQGFQFPRSPWWYTDAPFVGVRVVAEPPEAKQHPRP